MGKYFVDMPLAQDGYDDEEQQPSFWSQAADAYLAQSQPEIDPTLDEFEPAEEATEETEFDSFLEAAGYGQQDEPEGEDDEATRLWVDLLVGSDPEPQPTFQPRRSVADPSPEPAGSFSGIFRNEGGRTGQPTNLNSSALGRGQMVRGTRMAMYRKLGIARSEFDQAERQFRTDPDFEMQVMNAYRDELDAQIPSHILGKQREYHIAKGWYTGNPFYDDNKIPGRSAGNRLTAGEYARRAVTRQQGGYAWDKPYKPLGGSGSGSSLWNTPQAANPPKPGYQAYPEVDQTAQVVQPQTFQDQHIDPRYQTHTQVESLGYDIPDWMKAANVGMLGITGVANWINGNRQNQRDQERMEMNSPFYRPQVTNYGLSGINNVVNAQQGKKVSKYRVEINP